MSQRELSDQDKILSDQQPRWLENVGANFVEEEQTEAEAKSSRGHFALIAQFQRIGEHFERSHQACECSMDHL